MTTEQKVAQQLALVNAVLQATGTPRTEKFMGHEYLAVPAVLVQAQILHNNLGATFLPPAVINDDWAGDWNGAPVVIHDHPSQRGVPVSARSPEIMDTYGVGYVFRARAVQNDEGIAQLKAEVWLDLARAEEMEELATIIERLQTGQAVELSTGFAAMAEERAGVHNGEQYERVLYPNGADHLAIFAEKIGACSLEDGCGLGVQRAASAEATIPIAGGREGDAMEDTVDSERGRLLAFMNRCLDALGRHGGNSVAEAEATLAAEAEALANNEEEGSIDEFRCLLRRLKVVGVDNTEIGEAVGCSAGCVGLIERGRNKEEPTEDALEKLRALATKHEVTTNVDLSDEDRRRLLADMLQAEYGGLNTWVWIDAVFSETNEVVFGVEKKEQVDQLYKAPYEIDDDGVVNVGEPVAVKRRTVYDPVQNVTETKETEPMDKKDETQTDVTQTDAVAANESEKEVVANTVEEPKEVEVVETPKETETEPVTNEEEVVTLTREDLLEFKAMKEELAALKAAAAPAIEEKERERQSLVEELAANEKVPFDKAELEAKPVDELRKLHAMSRGADYSGRGGPRVTENKAEPKFAEPVPYWVDNKKDGE